MKDIKKKEKLGILYVRIPEDRLAWLKKQAVENNYSVSQYLSELIRLYMEK
jgi:hypothetical protein